MRTRRSFLLWALLAPALLISGRAAAQPPPLDLAGGATGQPGQVVLEWAAPQDINPISGYNIYWATGSAPPALPGTTPQASLVSSTTYTTALPSPDDGTPLAYWVTTVDSGGESAPAGPLFATSGLPAPAGLTVTALGVSQVALAWSPPPSLPNGAVLSDYQIFYSTLSSDPFAPGLTSTSVSASLSATVLSAFPDGTPFQPGVLTWFWVAGAVGQGPGAFSNGAPAMPYAAPAAPSLTAAPSGFAGIAFSVSPGSEPTPSVPLGAFTVFETLNAISTTVATLNPLTPTVTLSAGVLPCGVGVTLQAQATDIEGNTGTPSQKLWLEAPCAPTVLAGPPTALSSGNLDLAWTAPAGGAAGYAVYSATGPAWAMNPLPTTVTAFTSALSFTSAVSPGRSLWFRVYAVDSQGLTSAASNEVGLLAPPTPAAAIPSTDQVYLSWTAPAPASSVGVEDSVVYYSSAPGFEFGAGPGAQSLTVEASATGVTVTGLQNFTPYAFALASQSGAPSPMSGTLSSALTMTTGILGPSLGAISTSPSLGANVVFQPDPLTPSGQGSTLLVQWSNNGYSPLPSTVYTLYQATDATATPQTYNSITPVAAVSGATTFLSFTAGAPGPAWYFLGVSDSSATDGVGATGDGGADTTNARTLASAYFAPNLSPSTLTQSAPSADGRVLLRWNPVPFADTYSVYRATQDRTTVGASGLTYSALATSSTPAVFSLLGTVPGTTATSQVGGPLTSTALAYIDTAPVENARNAYEVVPSMQVGGGGLLYGPASNAVTTTPRVLPSDPGLYLPSGLSATAYPAAYFVTATALADSRGVFLEWAPAGDGTYPISYYSVYRGFSPSGLSLVATTTWFSYAPTTVTVHGVTFAPPMPHYIDRSAPQPWSDLYYGVSATDVSGNSSPDIVTATVGAALVWPAPLAESVANGDRFCSGCPTTYGAGQVNLDWAPGAYVPPEGAGFVTISAGTFPFAYWQIQRVSAPGAAPLTLGAGLNFGQYLNITAPANTPGNLTTDAATTAADISPTGGTPLYLISAVDVQGGVGVPLGLSVTVPTSLTDQVPGAVTGLSASAGVTLGAAGLNIMGASLTWAPNPASDAVSAYEVYRRDAFGVSNSVVPYPPYIDALGDSGAAGEGITYTVAAMSGHGFGVTSTPLLTTLSPPAPVWISFTADIPAGVSQTPAVGLVWQDILHPDAVPFGDNDYSGSYNVFRSDDPSTPLSNCAGLTGAACVDLSPLSNASYSVESVATNDAGSGGNAVASPPSAALALTLTAAPAPPSALSVFAGSAGLSLSWAASPSSDTYEYWIYRSSAAWPAGPDYGSLLARVSTTAYVDTGTLATADFGASTQAEPYYAVAAASPFAVGSALTATAALAPPTKLSALAGGVGAGSVSATVTLSWAPSISGSLVTGYDIWRATESASGPVGNTYLSTTAAVVTYTAGVMSFADTSVTAAGLTDTVLVYSVMAQGVSPGACASVTVKAYDLPRAPVALQGNGLPNGVDLSWRPAPASQGVTGYEVDWTVLDGGPSGVTQVAASPQTWSLDGLVPGQSVDVTLTALNSAGASLSGATTTVAVNAEGPAVIPASFTVQSGLSATAALPGIFLNVSAPAASEVVIYRSPAPGAVPSGAPLRLTDAAGGADSPYYLTTLAGTFTSMTDTAVSPLVRYSYAVTAVNANGFPAGESAALASSPTVVTAYVPWAAPAMAASAGNARVDLSWTAPPLSGAGSYPLAAYRLYRQEAAPLLSGTAIALASVDPGFPKTFALASLTQNAYTDTQVMDGLPYTYDMTSVDSQGNESPLPSFPVYTQPVNGATVTYVEPVAPLPAPVNLSATVGGFPNMVTLDWVSTQSDTSAGATYNIYRRQEYGPTTCTGATAYGPPLADGFHVGPSPFSSYGDVTLAANVFVDGAPGEPDPPQDKVAECYAVSAVDAAGEGPKSQEVCVTPYNPLVPVNNNWTVTIVNTTQVRLQWDDVPVAGNSANGGYATLGYAVERSSNDGNTFTQIAFVDETPNATASTQQIYTDTNLNANGVAVKGVSYYYNIYPVDVSENAGTAYGIKTVDIPSGTNSLYVYRNSFDPMRGGFVPIQCGLQQPGTFWIKIFTLNGEYVNTIIPPTYEGGQPSNPYLSAQVDWYGNNSRGETVASGVYLIHLQGPGYIADARVAVIK